MAKLFEALKKLFVGEPRRADSEPVSRSRDPQFVGRSSAKEIEQASPERIGELVGHAPERVET